MIYIYNIGTLAILSENATLLSENCSNCKCCGIHMLIVFICTATTTTKKLRTKVKLDQISHRTQKWTGQNYWHHVKTFQACDQSRSSLYAEYTSCVGPPKHQGARLCSQRGFHLVSFLKLASGYENMNDQYFNAVSCHPLYVKNHSNHVTWTSYSLLHETPKITNRGRDAVSRVLSVSVIRDGVKRGQMRFIHSFIQSFWENVLWTDETKVELFGKGHYGTVYRKRNEAFKEKNTVPTVKHRGSSKMFLGLLCCFWHWLPWLCERYHELWWLPKHFGAQRSVASVRKLRLHQRPWVFQFQQDNDPKHTSKITQTFYGK